MLDRQARRIIDPGLEFLARALLRMGLNANLVTIIGFLIGMAGCVAISRQAYVLALVLILMNRLADGLDGSLARLSKPSDVGGFLDLVLDTIFYSGVPFAFALQRVEYAVPAAFLIYSFVGTGGSFLAFATVAAKRRVSAQELGKKSFYYSAGLMEGTETIVFFVLFCVLPDYFPTLAWVFGGLCWLTTLIRIVTGVYAFRVPPHDISE